MLARLERTHRLLLELASARTRRGEKVPAALAARLGEVRRRLMAAERLMRRGPEGRLEHPARA